MDSKITATWDTLPNGSFFFEMHKFDVEGEEGEKRRCSRGAVSR